MSERTSVTGARQRETGSGFTLIELMIVIVIIGVFAGIAADFVGASNSNNLLTEASDQIQGLATRARSQVLQDRRAYVLEFRENAGRVTFWVNALAKGDCWSNIDTHCIESYDALAESPAFLSTDVRVISLAGHYIPGGVPTGNCTADPDIGLNGALCFSGLGYVMYREGPETNAACGSTDNIVGAKMEDWGYLCPPGFMFRLNRMEGALAAGVERTVNIPIKDVPTVYAGDAGP